MVRVYGFAFILFVSGSFGQDESKEEIDQRDRQISICQGIFPYNGFAPSCQGWCQSTNPPQLVEYQDRTPCFDDTDHSLGFCYSGQCQQKITGYPGPDNRYDVQYETCEGVGDPLEFGPVTACVFFCGVFNNQAYHWGKYPNNLPCKNQTGSNGLCEDGVCVPKKDDSYDYKEGLAEGGSAI